VLYRLSFFIGKSTLKLSFAYLIALKKVNHSTIAQYINESIIVLFFDTSIAGRECVLISDATPYITKAGVALKICYPNFNHVTRFAHTVHHFAEEIRNKFLNANKLISTENKVLMKAPLRIQTYRELSIIPLPPEPVITRWDSWIKSALFYRENFMEIKGMINQFNSSDALTIREAKEVFENP